MERMTHTFLLDPRPATDAFCTNYGTGSYEIRAVGIDSDGYPADAGLPDVTIQYRCGGRKCTLGTTSAIQGRYALQTRVPGACTNPTILANKEGYLTSETTLSADTWLNLTKKKTLPVRVVKHAYFASVDKSISDTAEDLTDETAVVHVRSLDGRLDNVVMYPANGSSIEFIDGKSDYEIDVIVSSGNTLIGGYHNSNITISSNQIAQAGAVTFHAIEYRPIPISQEEQQALAAFLYGGTYLSRLAPEMTP